MLGYIANESKRFHVFVANRIREIRDHSHPSQWHYVPTEANPADLVSRGATAAELVEGPWFSGPTFLYNENPFSLGDANPQLYTIPADDPEVKKVVLSTKAKEPSHLMLQLERFSSWQKMKRVVAFCLKLRHGKDDKRSTEITATDLCAAEDTIISLVQQEAFPSEIESLRRKKAVKSSSNIAKLDPFLDHNGTFRIGGRINNGTLPYEVKHPVLLPRRSHITTALLLHVHEKTARPVRCETKVIGSSELARKLLVWYTTVSSVGGSGDRNKPRRWLIYLMNEWSQRHPLLIVEWTASVHSSSRKGIRSWNAGAC